VESNSLASRGDSAGGATHKGETQEIGGKLPKGLKSFGAQRTAPRPNRAKETTNKRGEEEKLTGLRKGSKTLSIPEDLGSRHQICAMEKSSTQKNHVPQGEMGTASRPKNDLLSPQHLVTGGGQGGEGVTISSKRGNKRKEKYCIVWGLKTGEVPPERERTVEEMTPIPNFMGREGGTYQEKDLGTTPRLLAFRPGKTKGVSRHLKTFEAGNDQVGVKGGGSASAPCRKRRAKGALHLQLDYETLGLKVRATQRPETGPLKWGESEHHVPFQGVHGKCERDFELEKTRPPLVSKNDFKREEKRLN